MKKATTIRYTPEARRLLKLLAAKLGVTQSAVIELAIRALAKAEGVTRAEDTQADHSAGKPPK
jgi:predicted transcriptional regulator